MNNKILIVCPSPKRIGGVANYYKIVASKSKSFDFFYLSRLNYDKVTIAAKILKSFLYIKDYIRFLFKEWKYELVVLNPSMSKSCLYRDSVFIRLTKLFRKKCVVFWRGFNHIYFNDVVKIKYRKLLNDTFFKANHTIVLGKNIYNALHDLGCNTPYSISTTILSRDFLLQGTRMFSNEKLNLLFLARLEKDKGIYDALETYKIIKTKYPFVNMTVAGSGSVLSDIMQKIEKENIKDVVLLGSVSGKDKYMAYLNADIYIFPSYYEGMPNSVLEAMGMGLPVVTSKVGGIPDFFESGKMGYMINTLSPEEYADAIFRLMEVDNMKQISEYNIQYANTHFLDDIVVADLENCLKNI